MYDSIDRENMPHDDQDSEESDEDMVLAPVKVRLLDLGWLYANKKNFRDFFQVLRELKSDELCSSEFIITLLDVFWDNYKDQMMYKVFVPYLLYLFFTMNFMINYVTKSSSEDLTIYGYLLGSILLLAVAYQVYIEAF